MRRALGALALLSTLGMFAATGHAQGKVAEPERLFRSREPLELTLIGPLQTLFKNRDTTDKKPQKATLIIAGQEGRSDTATVTLETRGHFRLRASTCRFAPLKVIFDKEAMKETVFRGQGSLKLTTHCQPGERYEQNLLIEESIYRMYNLLTPLSHRTRLAKIRYVPTEDTSKTVVRYGFFLEDDDEMAKRNGGASTMVPALALSDMDSSQLDLVSIFLYMIGNLDWSIYALHNMRVVMVEGQDLVYPVAYDFDFSGLVSAPYSGPPPQLPVKSVKERLFRGVCRKVEAFFPTLERFNAAKDSIYSVVQGQPGIEPARAKEAIDYLDGFFTRIKRPKDFDGALGYACRG